MSWLPDQVFLSLVHYPVYDRGGRVVTTSVTNLDIHDLSRLSRTFGLGGFYIIQPSPLQVELARRIIAHWDRGAGASYNETRKEAFSLIHMVPHISAMVDDIRDRTGGEATLVATTGRKFKGQVDYSLAREKIMKGLPAAILLGTGWGMEDSIIESSDIIIEPLVISSDYNHLSVRCAAAIILDRLFGK